MGTAGETAAQRQAVSRFAITDSPLTLSADVRPQQYLGVVGRAAAWLGSETGEAELWVHPLKLATDFRLDFKIPDYVDPVRGADVARTVDVRPEITTITYSHATFTVRQHILAPLDEAGLLVLLDVETFRPLEIVVSFKTVFQYAWPGAFGGQYTAWNDQEKAFVLSESLRERNGVIGSPWAATASTHPAHALPDAPNTFTIPVDAERAAREFVPIAIAGGIAPRDSVLDVYRRLIGEAEQIYDARRAHAVSLLESTTSIDTPDDELDLAFAWSKINLDEQLVCNPDLGCGLVAGWGTSGSSTRPGFGWFFGGDAAINSFAMDATGLWPQVAQELRFLARYQRDDGKITHEISQAAGRIPWFTEFPYAYYHADTTPYWIVAVWRYWRASGDDELVRELWPAIEKAFAWCLTAETDGDGIIENTVGGLGAIEVGALGAQIHQDIYLASVWIEALGAMPELLGVVGEEGLSDDAIALYGRAVATLNDRYWREAEGHHAFGILRDGTTNDNLTVWPATAAAFSLLRQDRAKSTLRKLAGDAISSDWGARMLSTGSPLYDPMAYNMGAVWPFVTGFVSWGQYNYNRPWAGYPLIDALKQMTFDWARGRHPELLSGAFYRPLDQAVPHQFFATSMLVSPVMLGMLGWEPHATSRYAKLTPQLPPQWDEVRLRNLRVGDASLDVVIEQEAGRLAAEFVARGPAIQLAFTAPFPLGVQDTWWTEMPEDTRMSSEFRHRATFGVSETPTRIELHWDGGLYVEPPSVALQPGQASNGIRIVDFTFANDMWTLDVEGVAGRTYELRLHGEQFSRVEGASLVERDGWVSRIALTLPAGDRRTTHRISVFR
jgi:glycogen debranching enzyme